MKKTFRAFKDAGRGLRTVLKEERNFKIEIIVSFLVILFSLIFQFSINEIILLVIAIFMVLSAEIVNTAVEDICDKIEPNYSSSIGKIKDITASYVLVTGIGAIVIGLLVLTNHFFN